MSPDASENPDLDDAEEIEEFSFDQLSAAYARVLKQGTDPTEGTGVTAPVDKADLDDSPEEPGGSDLPISHSELPPQPAEASADDNAACPVSPETIVESILFVGAPKDVNLTSRKIAAILRDVSPKEVSKIVKQLNARYESEQAAYRITNDKGVLKMELESSLNAFKQEFYGRDKSVKLSQTAIDVLAVVAYNQPVTRADVERVRGKSSGGILNQLVRRNLLYIEPGEIKSKKQRYATTEKFLDFFHLTDLDDLPQSHEVSDFSELAD